MDSETGIRKTIKLIGANLFFPQADNQSNKVVQKDEQLQIKGRFYTSQQADAINGIPGEILIPFDVVNS